MGQHERQIGSMMAEDRALETEGAKKSFFLYGALTQGNKSFSRFFKEGDQIWSNVFVRGNAYRLEVGFPVLCLEPRETQHMISGELITSDMSDLVLNLMDEFHGYSRLVPEKSLYLRKNVEVLTSQGVRTAMTYVINPIKLPKTAKLIEAGDWQKSLVEAPPLTQKLSDREQEYVQRLGRSTGREIVPVQLDLYRSLMKMGLIVDKGRRLALSKLGQEVLRFLE